MPPGLSALWLIVLTVTIFTMFAPTTRRPDHEE